ncbi:MAG TPA: class I SAM-dependent methyltransferase [Thermoplasmata archaeon]|nr:class I SAM-dependent methyltransferase [Thermoplasmata archaeon]
MAVESWARMAEWYDAKQGDAGDLWHRTLIDPTFLRVVGDVRGRRVLDLACGNGYLSRRFARAGANVVGVDASAPILARARAREEHEPLGIVYHVADAADLHMMEDAGFDVVACNMAFMDMEDVEKPIRESARILRPGGRLVASLSHPCFDQGPTSTWLMERLFRTTNVSRRISRYREPFVNQIPWEVAPGQIVTTPGYHRPLSWYARALREAGFLIRSLEEPAPTPEFLTKSGEGSYIAEIPMQLVIEAVRVPA